ncbi:MAG: TRAP transporter small permease subunit [Deltaproteobacteria bacterium]|nr:TRAP transporter small permease subunit [Deltaproteobacteria bacterium]
MKIFVKFLNHLEEIALAYISLGLGILIVLEIMIRSTGITAFYWLEELGRYVLIFMTLCGANLAIRYGRHPSMTALFSLLPAQISHVVKAVVWIFLSGFFAYIDFYAWAHIKHIHKLGFQTSTLGVSFVVPYLPIGVFIFFMCIRYFLEFLKEIKAFRNGEDFIHTSS